MRITVGLLEGGVELVALRHQHLLEDRRAQRPQLAHGPVREERAEHLGGHLHDVEAVGEAVRRAVKRSGARIKGAAVAVAGSSVITKVVPMPNSLSDDEMHSQIELEADQYIPFPMEEVSFDYEIIGPNDKDPELMDVLLVATRTENVEQRQAAVNAAGLNSQIVDVEAFALENACRLLSHQIPDNGIG